MSLYTVLLLLVMAGLAAFVAVNWAAFTAPTTLSFILGTVQAPLGVVMLIITAALAGVFIAYALYLQTTVLVETRRMTRELHRQRELAEQAETSRITELRGHLDGRLEQLRQALEAERTRTGEEAAQRSAELRVTIENAVNGLAAQIAELDDRLHGPAALLPPSRS